MKMIVVIEVCVNQVLQCRIFPYEDIEKARQIYLQIAKENDIEVDGLQPEPDSSLYDDEEEWALHFRQVEM